jgi:MOSC domain-containing protein YiiM
VTVHGGEQKGVYCYPSEHYGYSKRELPERELPMAVFGENFTTEGLLEDSEHLGDRLALSALRNSLWRSRAYKLGIRFQDDGMVKRFLASGRTGFYFAVMREGQVGAGDEIKVTARDSNAVAIS